jgi:hypothetical protein
MIHLIGDSHTDKIRYFNEDHNSNIEYSFHQGHSAYSFDYSKNNFKKLDQGGLVIPWFGYIDCKVHLPYKLDTIYTVKRYMGKTLGHFKNQVRFMEPIPQLIRIDEPGVEDRSYEERVAQHNLFVKYLHIYSKEFGLVEPIRTSEIIGVDVNTVQYEYESRLQPQAYKKILDHLVLVDKDRNKVVD